MSETIKQVWLKDRSDNKVAPYTTVTQVVMDDGTILNNTIDLLNSSITSLTNGTIDTKQLVFNDDGTVTWTSAE